MTISRAIDAYLGELTRAGRSPRTVVDYRRTLDALAAMFPELDVRELDASRVRRFLDGYQTNRKTGEPNSPLTIGQRISHVDGFLEWLFQEAEIPRNPAERIRRPRKPNPVENDNIVTISSEDGRLMLLAAADMGWPERIAVNLALFSGARREALSRARRSDYDPFGRTLTLREKGQKTVVRPVSDALGDVLDAAIFAGVYADDDDYLIPSLAMQRRPGVRDARIVSRLVARVADRAGVRTHVHALRAAFAVQFLEAGLGDVYDLKAQLGHARIETTEVYLRRHERRRSLDAVRRMDWGLASTPVFEANPLTEKEGFEPSFDANPHGNSLGIHREAPDHG